MLFRSAFCEDDAGQQQRLGPNPTSPRAVESCYPKVLGARMPLQLTVEFDQEDDGRWIAAIPSMSGVMVYGSSREEARRKVHALALHVLADRLEAGELQELPSLTLHDAA